MEEGAEADAAEELGGTNANPLVDIAQAATTAATVIAAAWELTQPGDPVAAAPAMAVNSRYAGQNLKCKEFADDAIAQNPSFLPINYTNDSGGPFSDYIYANSGLLSGQGISLNGSHSGAYDPSSGTVYDNNFPGGIPLPAWGAAYEVATPDGEMNLWQSNASGYGTMSIGGVPVPR